MYPTDLEAWQIVFRQAVAPLLSTEQLQALHTALELDDPRLLQGSTTSPPAIHANQHHPCQAACPLGFVFLATGALTVGDVEEQFARIAATVEQQFGEPGAIRHFLNWWDDSGREHACRCLLAEVTVILTARGMQLPDAA